ncbi:MAG: phosphatase PAP2 family protein [Pseudomonadota bacterium]
MKPALPRADDRTYSVPTLRGALQLLPPPPADEAAQQDLEAVHAAQQSRTPEQIVEAEASSAMDAFVFDSVLGPAFTRERVPGTAEFIKRVFRSSLPHLQATKNCWNRPRPFMVDPTIAPLERSLASTRLRFAPAPAEDMSYAPSYPSGHAFVGAMLAILLSELVPERRVELSAFGRAYGDARVTSGVHFPSDVEAGRMLAALLVEALQQDARFRADLRKARQELRRALGYR